MVQSSIILVPSTSMVVDDAVASFKSNTMGIADKVKSIASEVGVVGLLGKVPLWSVVTAKEPTGVVAGIGADAGTSRTSGSIVFATVVGARVFRLCRLRRNQAS